MKKKSLKLLQMFAIILGLVLVISACGGNNDGNNDGSAAPEVTDNGSNNNAPENSGNDVTEPEAEELEFVNLKWYVMTMGPLPDNATVNKRVNEILEEKINAHVEIIPIPSGEIKDRMLAIMASGEEYDLVWTGNWANNYANNVNNGAYIPLDDLLNEYAPAVVEEIPEFIFDATRIGGEIYGVPNYQTVTKREGFIIRKDMAEKYDLDVSSIKKMEDITPFLEQIKEGEPNMIPFAMAKNGPLVNHALGTESIQSGVGIDLLSDDPYEAVITIGTDRNINKLKTVYEWREKGLINTDAAERSNTNDLISTGQVAVYTHNVLYPGSEQKFKNDNGGHEVVLAYLEEPWVSTDTIITTMQAISKTSKNPERAMMLINLVNTDKELYNTLLFGIEGVHYDFVADGVVRVNPDAGYKTQDWLYGNTFNRFLYEGEKPEDRQAIIDENLAAIPSPLMGFTFDREPINTERANLDAIYDRYGAAMNTGLVHPDEIVPEFVEANMTGGIEKIQEEVQRQINEWRAASGK